MGSLILCHDQHAAHPYEITRIHCKIFTMEELCYYLCNNLYLIDYTIMNEQLCGWLEEDIGKRELADQLRDVIRMRGSVEKFVLTILKSSGIYKEAEMIRILNEGEDENTDPKFYGKIYASLGSAYGRMFLYQQAARMYDRAYQICEDPKLLKPYLYASYKYMSMEEYHILLTKNDTYAEINTELRSEMKEIREGIQMEMSEQLTDKWKQQYRRSHI